MANRQYVGARYVPKFADPVDWNGTLSYEALTIVTHLGNSFTSKKPVPAGVDIGNAEYWVNTGNYNEQVATYQQQVVNVAEIVTNMKSKLPVADMSNIITVGTKGCMFSTINAAITEAKKYCTPDNRVAIIIFEGVYNEQINLLGNPGIDLIGVGDVEIQYASVYPNSPLHTTGTGHFSNIFFHALSSATPSYGLHIEAQEDSTAGKITFDNCSFLADAQSGVGIGLGTNFEVVLQNCTAVSPVSAGLYCHNYPQAASNQTITLKNCILNGSTFDLCVDDARLLAGGNIGESYFNVNVIGGVGYHNTAALKVATDKVYNYFADNVSNLVVGKQSICRGFPGADYYLRSINYTTDGYFTNGACAIPAPDNYSRNYSATAINPKTETSVPVTVTPVGQTLNVIASGFSDGVLRVTVTGTIKA